MDTNGYIESIVVSISDLEDVKISKGTKFICRHRLISNPFILDIQLYTNRNFNRPVISFSSLVEDGVVSSPYKYIYCTIEQMKKAKMTPHSVLAYSRPSDSFFENFISLYEYRELKIRDILS